MKTNRFTFPFPVLGINNNVAGGLVPEIMVSGNEKNYQFKIILNCNNNEIVELVKNKNAVFVCEINCSYTIYREVFLSHYDELNFEIPRKQLKGKCEILISVVSTINRLDYRLNSFSNLYEGLSFELEKGNIIGLASNFFFDADIRYEKEDLISSIIVVVEDNDSKLLNINLESDKVEIRLPSIDFSLFKKDQICKREEFSSVFHLSYAILGVSFALMNIKNDEYSEYLWNKTLKFKIGDQNLEHFETNFENSLKKAQELLGNPNQRALQDLLNFTSIMMREDNE